MVESRSRAQGRTATWRPGAGAPAWAWPGSLGGWHTLVLQVGAGTVRYFVDGRLAAEHGGRYYPDSNMAFDFNLWFQRDGLAAVRGRRSYSQDVDWVFQQPAAVLSPEQVPAKVAALRRSYRGSGDDTSSSSVSAPIALGCSVLPVVARPSRSR